MAPKWLQNGSKMAPKWLQDDPKITIIANILILPLVSVLVRILILELRRRQTSLTFDTSRDSNTNNITTINTNANTLVNVIRTRIMTIQAYQFPMKDNLFLCLLKCAPEIINEFSTFE